MEHAPHFRFSTQQVAAEFRFKEWSRHVERFCGAAPLVDFDAGTFEGRVDAGEVAGLRCGRLVHSAGRVMRRSEMRRSSDACLSLMMGVRGHHRIEQEDDAVEVGPGEIVVWDPFMRSCMTSSHCEYIALLLPRLRMPELSSVRPTVIRGAASLVISSLIRPLSEQRAGLSRGQTRVLADCLLDLVKTTVADRDVPEVAADLVNGQAEPLLLLVQDYIASNVAQRELTPQLLAEVHGISVRQLHRLFSNVGTTVGEWIRNCRLERCAAELGDSLQSARGISEIAYRWGFNEAAHFSRVFKTRFGLTPREFRAKALARACPVN
jgi:AraC-like DNA-binding protein